MTTTTKPRAISLTRFAEEVGVSTATASRWAESGKIAAVKTGGKQSRYLVPVTEVDRLLAEAQANRTRQAARPADASEVDWLALGDDPAVDLVVCDEQSHGVAVPQSMLAVLDRFVTIARENPGLSATEVLAKARLAEQPASGAQRHPSGVEVIYNHPRTGEPTQCGYALLWPNGTFAVYDQSEDPQGRGTVIEKGAIPASDVRAAIERDFE